MRQLPSGFDLVVNFDVEQRPAGVGIADAPRDR
jgi:hypothetical protein